MRTSERATALVREMPQHERPISEEYRIVAKQWCQLDSAARMLEENKTSRLAELMMAEGDIPVSRAEMRVKASQDWKDYLKAMVDARTAANEKKEQLTYIRFKFAEWQANDATARAEMKLVRAG